MSNTDLSWRQFNHQLIWSFVASGYQAIESGRKTGLHAISGICNYEFKNSCEKYRLQLWFGFSNVKREPLRNIKMYEVLFSEKENVEQLLGRENVKWDCKTKKYLRVVEFGEVAFDVSDQSQWADNINWSMSRVKLMDEALLRAFIKFPIKQ